MVSKSVRGLRRVQRALGQVEGGLERGVHVGAAAGVRWRSRRPRPAHVVGGGLQLLAPELGLVLEGQQIEGVALRGRCPRGAQLRARDREARARHGGCSGSAASIVSMLPERSVMSRSAERTGWCGSACPWSGRAGCWRRWRWRPAGPAPPGRPPSGSRAAPPRNFFQASMSSSKSWPVRREHVSRSSRRRPGSSGRRSTSGSTASRSRMSEARAAARHAPARVGEQAAQRAQRAAGREAREGVGTSRRTRSVGSSASARMRSRRASSRAPARARPRRARAGRGRRGPPAPPRASRARRPRPASASSTCSPATGSRFLRPWSASRASVSFAAYAPARAAPRGTAPPRRARTAGGCCPRSAGRQRARFSSARGARA